MCHYLINRRSFCGVSCQNFLDKVLRGIADGASVREAVLVHPDLSIGCFDIICLEWWLSNYQCVDDDSERPNVDLEGVALLALKDLRGDVVGGATNSSFLFAVKLELCGEAEVADFDFHLVVEEKVTKLEVSMDDPVRM